MTEADILEMVRANLQLASHSFDTYITQLIKAAREAISIEGIVLDDDSYNDINLLVMYASWLYRNRTNTNELSMYWTESNQFFKMPRMLRWALNQRLLQQKMGAAT